MKKIMLLSLLFALAFSVKGMASTPTSTATPTFTATLTTTPTPSITATITVTPAASVTAVPFSSNMIYYAGSGTKVLAAQGVLVKGVFVTFVAADNTDIKLYNGKVAGDAVVANLKQVIRLNTRTTFDPKKPLYVPIGANFPKGVVVASGTNGVALTLHISKF